MSLFFKRWYFFLVFILAGFFNLNAQEIKRLNNKEGLLRGTINKFEKDSLGYMWVATSKGINRYSGTELKKYNVEVVTTEKTVEIVSILNFNGELLLLSQNGSLLKYDYEFDRFKEILYQKKKSFFSFAKLNDTKIIIGLSYGFITYDFTSNKVSKVFYPETFINREIIVDDTNIYVASAKGCDHFFFDEKNNTILFKNKIVNESDVIDIGLDENKTLWIGTEIGGLYTYKNNKLNKVSINQISKKTNAIRKIEFDKNNNALVAIDRLGLFVMDENLQVIKTFSHDINQPNTISQNSIYQIFVDSTNAYWLGLREGGINIIYQKDNVFNEVKHILNSKKSISNNTIRSIYETEDGDLWFGTEDGVSKYNNQKWTNFNQNDALYNTAILSINQYENELLLGSYGQGVLKINPKTGNISKPSLTPQVGLDFVFTIHVFNKNIWVSGIDGPLHHYYENKLVNQYKIGLVRSFAKGFDEINYAGSSKGLFEINKRNKSTRIIKPEVFNTNNEVHALELDPVNNCIWIGSIKGIYKYNLSDESLENVGIKLNREIGAVFSIKKDNLQHLYFATISGLWRYDIKNEFFRKFDSQDGLTIGQFGAGANAKLKGGQIAFGGPEGAVVFNPYQLEDDKAISNIYISNLEVNGENLDSISIKKNINFLDDITLEFNQNSISFNFETIKFHGSKQNVFEYKLEGYDKNYKKSYANEKITYANIPSGSYELIAHGYNADGFKGENEFYLPIKINKPFWKTWTAIAIYMSLFGLLTYLIIKITEANNRKRTDEDRIKFFVEVAHDIRTPVSLIQLLVKQLINQKDVKKSIELIQRNSENLSEYVTQLLDFQKIDRNQLNLSVEQVDLKACISNIVSDFNPILEEKSIDITVNIDQFLVWFDKAKMTRIFYNLISNAIKYSNEGGQITINASLNENHLKIAFIDDGIGIPEKQQALIFQRFTRGTNVTNKGIPGTGIGLMLSKKIVELHGGEIKIKSKENIGSKFTIILPFGSEHYKESDLKKVSNLSEKSSNNVDDFLSKDKLILLVEDTKELREVIKSELEENYTVIEAENGKEGLLIALSKNPDLIITDVMMPKMNGKELCNLLKTNFKTSHIPIIMLTALADVDDKIKGLETGADAYLEKPFNITILNAIINNLLKSRENISRLLEDKKTEKKLTPDESFLSDVIKIIKENLTEKDFSIDTLAEKMGLSRSNLFRKLKGLIQMSPSNLIIKIKLNQSEELMRKNKNIRISDIAYESGFHDPKYFSTLFKKHYGKTPKEFIEDLD